MGLSTLEIEKHLIEHEVLWGSEVNLRDKNLTTTGKLLIGTGTASRDINIIKNSNDGGGPLPSIYLKNTHVSTGINDFSFAGIFTEGNNGVIKNDIFVDGSGFYNSGTPATIFRTSTNHPIFFYTNNLARIYIEKDGKVGIGQRANTYQLEVNGDIYASNNVITGNIGSFNGGVYSYSDNYFYGYTHYSEDYIGNYYGEDEDVSIYYDGTDFNIDTDLVNPSDLVIDCGTAKTLELEVPVYDDLQFIVGSGKVPASNAPTYETFTTNTRAYAFSVDDYLYLDANEIPHWWKEGTAGDCHLHFTLKTAQNSGSSQYAKFQVILAYADTNEVWVEQTMTGEATITNGTAALTNIYVDLGNVTLTNYLIGTQITARVKRIAATGGTEYADDVYITQTGIHLQKDTMGSRNETTK